MQHALFRNMRFTTRYPAGTCYGPTTSSERARRNFLQRQSMFGCCVLQKPKKSRRVRHGGPTQPAIWKRLPESERRAPLPTAERIMASRVAKTRKARKLRRGAPPQPACRATTSRERARRNLFALPLQNSVSRVARANRRGGGRSPTAGLGDPRRTGGSRAERESHGTRTLTRRCAKAAT